MQSTIYDFLGFLGGTLGLERKGVVNGQAQEQRNKRSVFLWFYGI